MRNVFHVLLEIEFSTYQGDILGIKPTIPTPPTTPRAPKEITEYQFIILSKLKN